MSRQTRHKIDTAHIRKTYPTIRERLPFFFDAAKRNATNLTFLITYGCDIALLGSVAGIESQEAADCLLLASQAHGALFAAAQNSTVTVPLGKEGETVTYSGGVDDSIVHASRWLNGFYLAALCRDWETIEILEQTPQEVLTRSRTRCPEYMLILVQALQAFTQNSRTATALFLKAMAATDPERADILAPDWVLYQDVPRIAALTYLFHKEPEFLPTLTDALAKHKTYYSKTAERRRDWSGFLALNLMGIGALAAMRGIEYEIDSEYWLTDLVQGSSGDDVIGSLGN